LLLAGRTSRIFLWCSRAKEASHGSHSAVLTQWHEDDGQCCSAFFFLATKQIALSTTDMLIILKICSILMQTVRMLAPSTSAVCYVLSLRQPWGCISIPVCCPGRSPFICSLTTSTSSPRMETVFGSFLVLLKSTIISFVLFVFKIPCTQLLVHHWYSRQLQSHLSISERDSELYWKSEV